MGKRGRFDYSRRAVLGFAGAVALATTLRTMDALAQATGGTMRIGVIGSGHIGSTIGGLWVKAGHPVLFSSRHPEELKELVAGLGPLAQNGTVQQAIAFGDALLIAVPYGALPQIGQEYSDILKGKIMLDACNAVPARDWCGRGRGGARWNRNRFAEISARHAARACVQHAFLYDLRARGEPS